MSENTLVFTSASQALNALDRDKLGTVYYRSSGVFVATAFGTGTFTYGEWEEAKGHRNSQVKDNE